MLAQSQASVPPAPEWRRDDRVVAVHRAAEEDAQFERVERLGDGVELGLEFLRRLVGGVLQHELLQRVEIGDLLLELLERIELGADGVGFADDFLRGLRRRPRIWPSAMLAS